MNWLDYLLMFISLVMAGWILKIIVLYTKNITSQTLINNESGIVKDEVFPNKESISKNDQLEHISEHVNDVFNPTDYGNEINKLFEESSNENKCINNDLTKNLTDELKIDRTTSFRFESNDEYIILNKSLQTTEISPESVLLCSSNNDSDANTSSIELQQSENEILEDKKTFFTARKQKNMRFKIPYQNIAENEEDEEDIINVLDTLNEFDLENIENSKLSYNGNIKEIDDFDSLSSLDRTESLPSTIHSNSTTDIQYVEDISDISFYNLTTSVDNMNDAFIQLEE